MNRQDLIDISFARTRKSFIFFLIFSFVFAVLKAIRLPNDWAEAHWLIGYQFGFIKRGLPGYLVGFFSSNETNYEKLIITVSIVVFTLLYIALISLFLRIWKRNDFSIDDGIVLLLFSSSAYITMSAHLMGYYDHLVVIILVIGLFLINKNQLVLTSFLLCFGMLIHEISLIICLPLISFHLFIKSKVGFGVSLKTAFLKVLILPLLVFLLIFIFNRIQGVSFSVLETYLGHFDFIENNRQVTVPDAFTHSFMEYLSSQISSFPGRILNPYHIFKIGVPTLFILFLVWKKMNPNLKERNLIFVVYLFCVFIPLILNAIAWDTTRIWSYILITTFIGYFSLKSHGLLAQSYSKTPILLIFIIGMGINFIPSLRLMDGREENFIIVIRIFAYLVLVVSVIVSDKFLMKMGKNIIGRTFIRQY